jgi:hypothetical protein
MPMTSRQWEARFTMSQEQNFHKHLDLVQLYGATVYELRQAVGDYLTENRPRYFDNYGDHIAGHKMYVYSDGKLIPPSAWGIEQKALSMGWWYYSTRLVSGRTEADDKTLAPMRFQDLEYAVEHFVTYALIPRKGPDYQSQAIVEYQLQLPLLESVRREAEEYSLNDLLLRGWHIVALEYRGEESRMGELTNRKATFVLGHPDLEAALCALDPDYYSRYW